MIRLLLLLVLTMPSFAADDPRFQPAQQDENGVWLNNSPQDDHGLASFLKWQWDTAGKDWQSATLPVINTPAARLQNAKQDSQITWIGHSSFLIQHAGSNILTDPLFSERTSPVQWAGPKRLTPLPFELNTLPPIHAVVISHSHYDHLDRNTVLALQKHSAPRFYVPMGLAAWFRNEGIKNVVELNWWQHHAQPSPPNNPNGDWLFTAVPAQHFSGRTATDRNKTLWAGWVMQQGKHKIYFAGDTGYSDDFKHIGDYFGGVDLALIPIGAYSPRWFMKPMHINPQEALNIHQDVRAKQSIGMHWGTFRLTDEPLIEPKQQLQALMANEKSSPTSFHTMQHGQTLGLSFK